jgi:two-component system OmpR family response regulator
MAKILLVDDDEMLASRLKVWLEEDGHVADVVHNGNDALQLLQGFDYWLIVLDWHLPDLEGIEVCRKYRAQGGQAYIIFLTGKDDVASKEEGFDAGSDDYLVKPVNVRELSARIRRMQRRQTVLLPVETRINGVILDSRTRVLTGNSCSVTLRAKEVALLEFLMRHPNNVYSAQDLLNAVWPSDSEGSCDSVRTWMMNIRKKLDEIGEKELIKTVKNMGYVIEYKAPES